MRPRLQLVYPLTFLDTTLPQGATFEEQVRDAHSIRSNGTQRPGCCVLVFLHHKEEDLRSSSPACAAAGQIGPVCVQVPEGNHVLALVVKGSVQVAGKQVLQERQAATLVGGQAVHLRGHGEGGAQVVLFWGKPIDAPVVWRGPFCGNSVEQIAGWMNAYQLGRMGTLEASF